MVVIRYCYVSSEKRNYFTAGGFIDGFVVQHLSISLQNFLPDNGAVEIKNN